MDETYQSSTSVEQPQKRGVKEAEGRLTQMLDEQAARIPAGFFFGAALGSIGTSLVLQLMNRKEASLFVGQWAPTFLLLSIYDKLVKLSRSHELLH